MTQKKDGGPAFPSTDFGSRKGMTLRDWFAGQALAAMIMKSPFFDTQGENGSKISSEDIKQFKLDMAASAYAYADAMLAEREN